MNDPIVMKLMSQKRNSLFESAGIKDKIKYALEEAEEDEEELDSPAGEEDSKKEEKPSRKISPERQKREGPSQGEGPEEKEEPKEEKPEKKKYSNPLQNDYATHYKIGDAVAIVYTDGTATEMKGTVDGYDPDGFYRIRLGDGSTLNGITDKSLSIMNTNEGTCVCGSKDFVTEGKSLVCDNCGRIIKESCDNRSKICPKPSNVTTKVKPSIEESIKRALRKKKINEDSKGFFGLHRLKGEFWTTIDDLVSDVEDLGFEVIDANDEYIIIVDPSSEEDAELQIPLGGTLRTKTLDLDRARTY